MEQVDFMAQQLRVTLPLGPSAGDVSLKFHLSVGTAPDPKQRFFLKKGKLFNVHKEVNNRKLRRYHKNLFRIVYFIVVNI